MLNCVCLAKWDLRRAAELTGWWQGGGKAQRGTRHETNRFSHFNLKTGGGGFVDGEKVRMGIRETGSDKSAEPAN